MSDEDNLIQFLERREIKVNRESEGYTVHTTKTSLDSEELEHIISLGRIFAMNVDYFLKVEYRNTSKILGRKYRPIISMAALLCALSYLGDGIYNNR